MSAQFEAVWLADTLRSRHAPERHVSAGRILYVSGLRMPVSAGLKQQNKSHEPKYRHK